MPAVILPLLGAALSGDLQFGGSDCQRRQRGWGQSRVELSHREALAVSLITLLLQPMSPPDSDSEEEEEEKPT